MRGYDHLLLILTFWIVYWSISLVLWYETPIKQFIDLKMILLTGSVLVLSYITGTLIYSIISQSLLWSLRFISIRFTFRRFKRRFGHVFTKRKKLYNVVAYHPSVDEGVTSLAPKPVAHMQEELPLPPQLKKKSVVRIIRDVN